MRWTPGDRSNIEDLRGRSGLGMRAGGLGIGGLLVLLILSWVSGVDFLSLIGGGGAPAETVGTSGAVASSPEEEKLVDFIVPVTTTFFLISDSSTNYAAASAPRATSRRPMWSRTNWDTTCSRSSALRVERGSCSPVVPVRPMNCPC